MLLHDSEVAQRIKEATGEANAVFLIPGHPMMRPNMGFIELPVGLVFRDSVAPLPEHAAVRVANYTEGLKKRAKLQRGKQRQGSSEEEEKEEEDDGTRSPIPWDDLATGNEDPPSA